MTPLSFSEALAAKHPPRRTVDPAMRSVLALFVALALTGCSSSPTGKSAAEPPASAATITLSAGDPAPAFSLSDSSRSQVSLASLTASGPAVLVFYRGDW